MTKEEMKQKLIDLWKRDDISAEETIAHKMAIDPIRYQCNYWDFEAGTCRKTEIPGNTTGRWNRISPAGIYECSECGQNVMTGDIVCYHFCHRCGAKMEGVK